MRIIWQYVKNDSKEPEIFPIIENTLSIINMNLLKGIMYLYVFYFEQSISAPDINYQRYTGDFWKNTYGLGTPYDFRSVMHYGVSPIPACGNPIARQVGSVTFSYLIKISELFFLRSSTI